MISTLLFVGPDERFSKEEVARALQKMPDVHEVFDGTVRTAELEWVFETPQHSFNCVLLKDGKAISIRTQPGKGASAFATAFRAALGSDFHMTDTNYSFDRLITTEGPSLE